MAANWSAENATRAYLRTLRMGKRGKEPDISEFISAIAAGNNGQIMVEICSTKAGPTTLALVAAAHQTGGRVICIVPTQEDASASKIAFGHYSDRVELVVGDAAALLLSKVERADFVLIDCNIDGQHAIFRAARKGLSLRGGVGLIVGYNAHNKPESWSEMRGQFLPIGDGLLVARCRMPFKGGSGGGGGGEGYRRSRWLVKVDKCTGEQHVYRITLPRHKILQANQFID